MAVQVIRTGEPDDSEVYFDPHTQTYKAKTWDVDGRTLKVGGPYKTERAALFAERRMMGFEA